MAVRRAHLIEPSYTFYFIFVVFALSVNSECEFEHLF